MDIIINIHVGKILANIPNMDLIFFLVRFTRQNCSVSRTKGLTLTVNPTKGAKGISGDSERLAKF